MSERTSSAVPIVCAGCGMEIQTPAGYIITQRGKYHRECKVLDDASSYVLRVAPKQYR